MSDFRDAVKEVQASAARQEWDAVENVLHDVSAERAARLTAANLLANGGTEGQGLLLRAVRFGDERTQSTALKAYLHSQIALDADLVLEVTQHPNRLLRRTALYQLKRLPYPVSDTFRLRCYLPTPFRDAVDPDAHLVNWLTGDGWAREVVLRAIVEARYRAAIPLLINVMTVQHGHFDCADALILFGAVAVPALYAALPESDGDKRAALLHALETIGGAEADAALRVYAPQRLPAARNALTAAAQIPVSPRPRTSLLQRVLTGIWNRRGDR